MWRWWCELGCAIEDMAARQPTLLKEPAGCDGTGALAHRAAACKQACLRPLPSPRQGAARAAS